MPLQSPDERKNAGGSESRRVNDGLRKQLRRQLAPTTFDLASPGT
ncbi:MAG: hypothetical protein ACK5EA_08840 [Planctomycetaceae bacterium]